MANDVEEIVVTAKRQKRPDVFDPRSGGGGLGLTSMVAAGLRGGGGVVPRTAKSLGDLLARSAAAEKVAKETGQTIEEIVVKGKRIAKRAPVRVPFGFAGGAVTGLASVGAMISDVVSQRRLDEAFRRFQAVEPRPKDSPVETIEPEVIPEIIVRGKRPQMPLAFVPDISRMRRQFFVDTFPKIPSGVGPAPRGKPQVVVPFPKKPKKVKPTSALDPRRFLNLFNQPGASPGPGVSGRGSPLPRSFTLGIGRPGPRLFDPLTPRLTGGNVPTLGLPQVQVSTRSSSCPPCPKPKRKKRRTQCWKKLVKEGRFASRDKTSRWNRIDCDTGKEIRRKR